MEKIQGLPGVQSEFTASLSNLVKACFKIKSKGKQKSGDVAKWQIACLECMRI